MQQAGFENLSVLDSNTKPSNNSLDLLTIADYRPSKPVPDYEKALEIATDKVNFNPHNLNQEQIGVIHYGVQSALTADVDGLKYFAAYLKNSPATVDMADTFKKSLDEVGIHSSVTIPFEGDVSVNLGRVRQDRYGVAEIANIYSSGRATAMEQVIPPPEPLGPRSTEHDRPRRVEDVLRSVAEDGLLSKNLIRN